LNPQSHEDFSRLYVRHVFAIGRITCQAISEGIELATQGQFTLPVNDRTCFETSLALLGTSISVLTEGGSVIMTAKQGGRVANFCKCLIEEDYGIESRELVIRYQVLFKIAMADERNPISDISQQMLERCLGSKIDALYLSGFSIINPLILQMVSDLLLMNVTEALTFWKGNPSETIRSINSYDENGYTSLMLAVKTINVELVAELIEQGANPKIEDRNFGTSTALDMAYLLRKRAKGKDQKKALKKIIALLEPVT